MAPNAVSLHSPVGQLPSVYEVFTGSHHDQEANDFIHKYHLNDGGKKLGRKAISERLWENHRIKMRYAYGNYAVISCS